MRRGPQMGSTAGRRWCPLERKAACDSGFSREVYEACRQPVMLGGGDHRVCICGKRLEACSAFHPALVPRKAI